MRCSHFSLSSITAALFAIATPTAWAQASLTPLQRDCDRYEAPSPDETGLFKKPVMIQWRQDLSRHLARFKPSSGLLRGSDSQRIAYVRFTIDAKGAVISSKIGKSSGSPELDEAALRSVSAASPLPAIPSEFARPRLDFEIPFNFNANIAPRFSIYNPDGIGCTRGKVPTLAIDSGIRIAPADATTNLSQADETVIRKGIAECWRSMPSERVALRLHLGRDGSLSEPPSAEDKSENARLAATTAGGQLMACKAFALDPANYSAWREIVISTGRESAEQQAADRKTMPAR